MRLPSLPSTAKSLAVTGFALCGATASAQFADECANAPLYTFNQAIAYDTNVCLDTGAPATSGGPSGSLCLFLPFSSPHSDVWLRWTPSFSGDVLVSNCNNVSNDSIIGVYDACSGTEIACNDDGPGCFGGSSELTFTATIGEVYWIRLGASDGTHGAGTLFISHTGLAPVPDTCATPLSLTGLGTDTIDLNTVTTSGFNGGGTCSDPGSNGIFNDAFWVYIAEEAGTYSFDTFGSTIDTVLSIHSGTDCNATCLDYSDDFGAGTDSRVQLTASAGDRFLVQVGEFGSATGVVQINVALDACLGNDDFFEENDTCAQAFSLNPFISSEYLTDLFVTRTDKDFFVIPVASGATVQIDLLFDNSLGDIDAFLRLDSSTECGNGSGADELATGFSGTDNETLSWTNTSSGCANAILEINMWDNPSNTACTSYDLSISNFNTCNLGIDATRFCDPMNVNSTGDFTKIFAEDVNLVEILLRGVDGPPNQFGYFLVSSGINEPGINLGSGRFCLGSPFGRYNIPGGSLNSLGQFDNDGFFVNLSGTGDGSFQLGFLVPTGLPFAGTPQIQSGQTWNFQLWHRESGGDSNFSHGLSVNY